MSEPHQRSVDQGGSAETPAHPILLTKLFTPPRVRSGFPAPR